MTIGKPEEERVLVLAPTGQDGPLAAEILQREGMTARAVPHIAALCEAMSDGMGVLLIAEEALLPDSADTLATQLNQQPPWSDAPAILMTSGADSGYQAQRLLELFSHSGNISLLERPFRIPTLLSVVRTALRARRRQYQVRELLRAQMAAMRQRDEFISIAGHELKTPLTSLKLQLQLSQRGIENADPAAFAPLQVKKLVFSANRQVDRLGRLVEDMLDLARIQTGKLAIDKRPVDLDSIVRELADRFAPQFAANGTTVDVHASEDSFRGNWDAYRIEQVVSNLLANALRYGANRPVSVRLSADAQRVRLSVKDAGPGIAAEDQRRIFERFERAVSSSEISGLGLGLYICREIVQAHHGDIRVVSAPGCGAEFIVELPR